MPQNFLLPAQSDMEGSVTWSGVSASPTLTNSTDFASTGTKSLKEVTTTTGTFKVALTTGRACTAKALTTFKMDVRSSVSKFIDWGVDWYTAVGGSYISTDVFSGAYSSTTQFDTFTHDGTPPDRAKAFILWHQYNGSAVGQINYIDNVQVYVTLGPPAVNTLRPMPFQPGIAR